MTALRKKSTLIVNLIALSCPLLLGTLQTQGVEPPEGPAPTVVPTRIAAPALQDFIPAQDETKGPATKPSHLRWTVCLRFQCWPQTWAL